MRCAGGGELRDHNHDESGFGHLLYKVYASFDKVAELPFTNIYSNCNVPIVRAYDEDSSIFKYSCLPREFINKKLLGFSTGTFSKSDGVKLLVKKINSQKLSDLLDWMRVNKFSEGSINFAEACFKPITTKVYDSLPDFSQISDSDRNKSNMDYWVSNHSLKLYTKSFCKVHNADYMGTIYLNFLNKVKFCKRKYVFDNSHIKEYLTDRIKNKNYPYYVGYISIFNHWSTLVIDKSRGIGYHYNSHGYKPSFQFGNVITPFSYDRMIESSDYINESDTSEDQRTIICILKYIATSLKLSKLYLNVEKSQLLDGECGIFSLVHTILTLDNIEKSNVCQLVYTFFKFNGDKRMREIRNQLCTQHDTFYTHNIESKECTNLNATTYKKLETIVTALNK